MKDIRKDWITLDKVVWEEEIRRLRMVEYAVITQSFRVLVLALSCFFVNFFEVFQLNNRRAVVKHPDLLVIKGSVLLSPASRCINGMRSIDATKEYSLPRFGCW